MPQRCCALASVLAAKRCHCGFGVPKAAVARLLGVRHQCLQQSRSIVETEFFAPDGAPPLSTAALDLLEDELLSEEVGSQLQLQLHPCNTSAYWKAGAVLGSRPCCSGNN